jgi:hypothetical protein
VLLNTSDRLSISSILPRTGDITTLRIVRDLERDLGFTEAEHAELKFREKTQEANDGRIHWVPDADHVKEIVIGPRAFAIISDALAALDKQKKLPFELMGLYERFVEGEPTKLGSQLVAPLPRPETVA